MSSAIKFWLKQKRTALAMTAEDAIQPVISAYNIKACGTMGKVFGILLHMSKAKKITITRTFGEKKSNIESSYNRLLFCRYDHIEIVVLLNLMDMIQPAMVSMNYLLMIYYCYKAPDNVP